MPTLNELIAAYGRIPPMEQYNRLMFVGPHPDDIEYGCGALISKLKDCGKEISYVIVTDGAAGTTDPSVTPEMVKETREQETLRAAAFMGVSDVEFLGLEDGGSYEVADVIRRLAPVVLKYRPEIIFAPDPKLKTECHPDHLKTGEAVRRLVKLLPYPVSLRRQGVDIEGINEFPDGTALGFYFSDDPNVIVPVTERNLGEKLEALMLHASQMQDSSTELLMTYFKLKALKLGEQTGTGFGEDYQVLIPIVQHCYSEGIHV